MDEKTLTLLEFPKILDRLAGICIFTASREKALALRPTADLVEARRRQQTTQEALLFLVTHADVNIGGVRDIRAAVDLALHGGVPAPGDFLDIKQTLTAARNLTRSFDRLQAQFPALYEIVQQLTSSAGLIDAITRTISERGEVLDSASEKLANLRRETRVTHERLMSRLQRMIGDSKNQPYLQEALITQRDGRYVIPLRAEFKGRIRSIIHDQSQSGATLFVEPLVVVDANNKLRELQLAERDEERRILLELSRQVAIHSTALLHTVDVIADLDLALACGRLAEEMAAVEPKLHELKQKPGGAPGVVMRLYQARHPLLDPRTVVPIDIELAPDVFAVIITGPNTGGKTVALKTIGLLAVMAQAGLHIPAHSGSEISLFDKIYADIGDEQSIEQSLSTFSGHVKNIIRILDEADPRSLVILDELGAGTDPQEGSALARAILAHLLGRNIATLVTTHHPELKAFAHATPGVVNASVEFDLETLRPTFHLVIGLPGRSNALAIAERLGLPQAIIRDARSEISPDDLRADDLLNEIHQQRDLSRTARTEAENARRQAEAMRLELLERLEKIEDERRALMEETRRESAAQVAQLHDEISQARKALARARQPLDMLKEVEDQADALEEQTETPVERQLPELGPAMEQLEQERRRAWKAGDKVRLRSLNMQGVIISLGEEEAEVAIGALRIRSRLGDLERPAGSGAASSGVLTASQLAPRKRKLPPPDLPQETQERSIRLPQSPGMELDLRGMRADDALDKLDRYLDAAVYSGTPFVRIIHGKGTGKLRDAVREALRDHPSVKSFEGGADKEGGEGVTVAKF